jgi:hypothetical protein
MKTPPPIYKPAFKLRAEKFRIQDVCLPFSNYPLNGSLIFHTLCFFPSAIIPRYFVVWMKTGVF